MSKWSQNQSDFGSTKPKWATLKKTFNFSKQSYVLILLRQQSALPDILLYV
jgi:hypothetical protein